MRSDGRLIKRAKNFFELFQLLYISYTITIRLFEINLEK